MTYKTTRLACYLGYIIQAIVNNLTPLLFVSFQNDFSISTEKLALLVAINFCIQVSVDLSSVLFIDRIGYRACVLLAHVFSCFGFILLSTLPFCIDAFTGILIATVFTASGGGLLEVVISPIVEALPTNKKAAQMALLHSFYCWGQMAVVLLSSLFFICIGISHWKFLALSWALIPLTNFFLFTRVPILKLDGTNEHHSSNKHTVSDKPRFLSPFFFICIILMFCAGATELSMSQWSSMFAEIGLGVDKTVGDLLGPCAFALMMGCGRILFGLFGDKARIEKWLLISGVLGIFSYLLTALSALPLLSLIGCMLTGLASALLWPGTYSLGAKHIRHGGTTMFALFALAGDIGCAAGPTIIGFVSGRIEKGHQLFPFLHTLSATEEGLRSGFLISTIFPLLTVICSTYLIKHRHSIKQTWNNNLNKKT